MKKIILICFSIIPGLLFPQSVYHGILLAEDSISPVRGAIISLDNTGGFTNSGQDGTFSFSIPADTGILHFDIYLLSCHLSIERNISSTITDSLFIDCPAIQLDAVEFIYSEAGEIVRRAIKRIPENYGEEPFICDAFFRHYQKINGAYKNLGEAQAGILFSPEYKRGAINYAEGIHINAFRESKQFFTIDDEYDDAYHDLMNQNPVYHLLRSSLNPDLPVKMEYSFAEEPNDSVWIIYYKSANYSTENHGIMNYVPFKMYGESNEQGKLVIDKNTLAFLSIERIAKRNPAYGYPHNNNYIMPSLRFTDEFVDGYLLAEYGKAQNGQYVIKKLFHSYTDQYYLVASGEKQFTISDYYEWIASEPVPAGNADKEYFSVFTNLSSLHPVYDPSQWQIIIPSGFFIPNDELRSALELDGDLEKQFLESQPARE